jgi:hypothetical protein
MTHEKPQVSKLRPKNLAKWALTCYGGSTHERLLSESSRSYMLEFRMYAISFWSKSPMDYLDQI